MMEDIICQKDSISYILVFKLSRFGRNAADILKSLQLLMDYGIDLISVNDAIDSSTQGGRLTLAILSAVAEIERENIVVQFMAGKMQKVMDGKWAGENPTIKGNMRDVAILNQLLVLANLESYNAVLINQEKSQKERMKY